MSSGRLPMVGWMVPLAVVLVLVLAGIFISTAIDPRSQWERHGAWQYRHPEAHEPSEAAYRAARVGAVVGLVMMVIIGVAIGVLMTRDSDDAAAPTAPPRTRATLPSIPPLPQPVEVGPLALVSHSQDPESDRRLVIMVRAPGAGVWWCNTRLRVVSQTATEVVIAATLFNALPAERQCSTTSATAQPLKVSLDAPLGERPVLAAGPMVQPDGSVTSAAQPRALPRGRSQG